MENVPPDENHLLIPKGKLPPEFEEMITNMQETAQSKLQNAEKSLRQLNSLIKAMQTVVQLTYDHQQLGKVKFEATTEWYMETESRTTSFIVTYGRLFTKSNGTYKIERSKIPEKLLETHDGLMKMRHELYAHNGGHDSVETYPKIVFDGKDFYFTLGMEVGMHVGGNPKWDALVQFINEHVHEQLGKIIDRLKEETGNEWHAYEGPAPDWLED